MLTLGRLLTLLIAFEHVYILVMEMFLWTTPRVMKTFGSTPEFAQSTRTLAANQGLYNGFLAAGLFWSVLHLDLGFGHQLQIFFLACVLIAGIYGGLTAKRSILYVQALPALIALIVTLVS